MWRIAEPLLLPGFTRSGKVKFNTFIKPRPRSTFGLELHIQYKRDSAERSRAVEEDHALQLMDICKERFRRRLRSRAPFRILKLSRQASHLAAYPFSCLDLHVVIPRRNWRAAFRYLSYLGTVICTLFLLLLSWLRRSGLCTNISI
jgi:hypothetical protein